MAVTITRTQVRQEIYKRLPSLGKVLTADSITKSGPSLTQVSEYEHQRAGLTSYEGQFVYRYRLTGNDLKRRITTLNSGANDGVVNVDGPAYADNADLAYERTGIDPEVINGFIAEAQRKQVSRTDIALVGNYTHDLDMETSGVQYWDGSLGGSATQNTTVTKITTSVRSGTQALQCTTTNATNIVWGERCTVQPNQLTYMAFIFKAPTLTGTLTLGVRDADSGAGLGANTITAVGGSGWMMTAVLFTNGATTTGINPYFESTASGDVYIIDTCFGPYSAGQTDFTIQTALNEAYKVRFVRPSSFKTPLQANFFDAESLVFDGDYTSPQNFVVETFRRDVVSNRIRLIPSTYYPNPIISPSYGSLGLPVNATNSFRPVWLAMEAQVSDFEPLLTETSTTTQPLDEVVSWTIKLLSEYIMNKAPSPYWQGVFNEYKGYAVAETMYRPPQPMMPASRFHQVRA